MRLLQLATGPDELIDLHPNVTVVSGLDEAGRAALSGTVVGLASGAAVARGLLEAHGVLFPLSEDMLGLLDVHGDGLRPVVTASELPAARQDPRARERVDAERALAEVEERWFTAGEEDRRVQAAYAAALEVADRARRNRVEGDAGSTDRIRLIDELTAQLDQAVEQRRKLLEQRERTAPEVDAAAKALAEVEDATVDVRTRHQEAALRCSALAAEVDEARLALDPEAVETAEATAAELARVQAEVAAERDAEAAAAAPSPDDDDEPAAERLARIQERIEDLEKRLAAYGPAELHHVASAHDQLRARHDGQLIPSREAQLLADEILTVDAELSATASIGSTAVGLADERAALDEAKQRLLEAEQASRNPELDRELVDRLEHAHAELLEAIDKADGRFGGARAQRRVDAARSAEHAILDELGFTSYSDYMMGNSLLHVDPKKEAALQDARAALAEAEHRWRLMQAQTDAELARAERMERRRLLVEEARDLLGRPVASADVTDELRAHLVPADVPVSLVEDLQSALDEAGVAVADEDLTRDDLLLLAEAWLTEAGEAATREAELRAELTALADERSEIVALVEAQQAPIEVGSPDREEDRDARLARALGASDAAQMRRLAHEEAAAVVDARLAALAAASEVEQVAAVAAADAEQAVADAASRVEELTASLRQVEDDLTTLAGIEVEANEHLQSLSGPEAAPPEDLERDVAEAETTLAATEARAHAAAAAMARLLIERQEAQERLAELRDAPEAVDAAAFAEEIEWYLLARLAAQRSVSLAGSVPLLLDDALAGLDEEQLGHVLGRIERMADAVQVIVVSDDPLTGSWALLAGHERAALVRPQPA